MVTKTIYHNEIITDENVHEFRNLSSTSGMLTFKTTQPVELPFLELVQTSLYIEAGSKVSLPKLISVLGEVVVEKHGCLLAPHLVAQIRVKVEEGARVRLRGIVNRHHDHEIHKEAKLVVLDEIQQEAQQRSSKIVENVCSLYNNLFCYVPLHSYAAVEDFNLALTAYLRDKITLSLLISNLEEIKTTLIRIQNNENGKDIFSNSR